MQDGFVVADEAAAKGAVQDNIISIPLGDIAKEASGDKLFSNTVAVGAIFGILCYDLSSLNNLLAEIFKKKGEEIIKKNIIAAKAGYDYVQDGKFDGVCKFELTPRTADGRILINGSDAVGFWCTGSRRAISFFISHDAINRCHDFCGKVC